MLEPSDCVFERVMQKSFELGSYKEGDQGFLDEVFRHGGTYCSGGSTISKFLYESQVGAKEHLITANLVMIHYLGVKHRTCEMDYSCNWDVEGKFRLLCQ